jgi:hypothetical protein
VTARSISLVSSGCNMDEGEGRVFLARPRDISGPDEDSSAERVLPVHYEKLIRILAAIYPNSPRFTRNQLSFSVIVYNSL